MKVRFKEPIAPRYIYINPVNNQIHLMLPIASGESIGKDNTCKSVFGLQEFFAETEDTGVLVELQRYSQALDDDISLIPENTELKQQKQTRLEQIREYIDAIKAVKSSPELSQLNVSLPEYPKSICKLMAEPSNLYSMVLRPAHTDHFLRTPNPVFSVKRDGCILRLMTPEEATQPRHDSCYIWDGAKLVYHSSDGSREQITINNEVDFLEILRETRQFKPGDRLQCSSYQIELLITNNCAAHTRNDDDQLFYNTLHTRYENIVVHSQGPKALLTQAVLASQKDKPVHFEDIQLALIEQSKALFGLDINFLDTQMRENLNQPYIKATKTYIDEQMGFDSDTTTDEYISALLNYCTSADFETIALSTMITSPFNTIENNKDAGEKISILTQFFLAEVNIYCASNGISDANFGKILDGSDVLSRAVAETVIAALSEDAPMGAEEALCDVMNKNASAFQLTRQLTPDNIKDIKQAFMVQYTEIKNSAHFDEFILLDTTKPGIFVNHQGSICTDFAEMIGAGYPTLDKPFFQRKRDDFKAINGVVNHRNDWIPVDVEMNEAEVISCLMNLVKQGQSGTAVKVFITALKALSPDAQTALITTLGGNLGAIITDFYRLSVLNILSPDAQTALIKTLRGNLGAIITDFNRLSVLKILSPDAQTALIKTLGGNLGAIIKDYSQLSTALKVLSAEAQVELIMLLLPHLDLIIKTKQELDCVILHTSKDAVSRDGEVIVDILSTIFEPSDVDNMDKLIAAFQVNVDYFITQVSNKPKYNQIRADVLELSHYLKENWSNKPERTQHELNVLLKNEHLSSLLHDSTLKIDRVISMKNNPVARALKPVIEGVKALISQTVHMQSALLLSINPRYQEQRRNVTSANANINKINNLKAGLLQLKGGLDTIASKKSDFQQLKNKYRTQKLAAIEEEGETPASKPKK